MAARLAIAAAHVIGDGLDEDPVMIVVRNNVAVLSKGGGAFLERDQVEAVADGRRGKSWTVRFAGGDEWEVTRSAKGGCKPCGR